MKRLLSFLLVLLLATLPVFATENNAFFNLHAAECAYDGREYLVNDPKGYLSVLDAPGGKVQDYFYNEQTVTVFALYPDPSGSLWAQLRYTMLSRGFALSAVEGQYIGWAPLTSLYRSMDREDFLALHEAEFVNRPMRFRPTEYPDAVLWSYPGAEKPCGYLRWFVHDESQLLSFPAWWQDPQGDIWALWEEYFLCLSHPERSQPSLDGDLPVLYPSVLPDALPLVVQEPVIPARPSPLPYYFMAVAAVLAALSFVLRKFTYTDKERK